MIIDPADLDAAHSYKLLIGSILSRPIAWVSTRSTDGVDNLAPVSFFTAAGRQPPRIHLSLQPRSDGTQQPNALAEIRAWTADIPNALDRQDAAIASGRFRSAALPVSVIFGRNDTYLNPDVAQHISGLFTNTQLHLLDQASHWPQWDRPETVADLIKRTIAASAPPSARAEDKDVSFNVEG